MSDHEGITDLPKRMARHARVAIVLGRLIAQLATERYLGVEQDPKALARDLRRSLGRLRGPIVKIAQLLATVPGALPADYVTELMKLQSQAPPMGRGFVRRRMTGELGEGWRDHFAAFNEEAAAAASLGQVHHAIGLDDRPLACKLQYPGMATAIDADLRELDLAINLMAHYQSALMMGNVRIELAERLREELDYTHEARNMRLYRDMLAEESGIEVPEPIDELSTSRLLTMTWLDGQQVLDFVTAPAKTRKSIATKLFRAWYLPFFKFGVLHGDAHLGNYTVASCDTLNLLDFGCVRIFPSALVQGVVDLYDAVRTGDEALAEHAYRTWRFEYLTKEVVDALNLWARFLFEPVIKDRASTLGPLTGEIRGRAEAERVIARLHRAGGVDIPREFVIMDRVAIGLGAVFLQLQAKMNWHRLFEDVRADFDPTKLQRNQEIVLQKHGLPLPHQR